MLRKATLWPYNVGMTAPNFSLADQTGTLRKLTDFAGQWVILYFYPKDDTPGCTTEACSFRDEYEFLKSKGLNIIGVSKDSVASHLKFANKYHLNFPLLSDPGATTIKAYDAWGSKKFMGRTFEGIRRQTFLIDPAGEIVKSYPNVSPKGHALQILEDFEQLQI